MLAALPDPIVSSGRRHTPRGFGLVEMMIVIAIVAILAALALPSYRQVIKSNRVTTDTNDLVTAFNLARNEAVSRGRPVTVCASIDGASCAAAGTSWSSGWIVFTDYGTLGQVNSTNGDAVLRVWPAWTTQDSVTGGTAYVSFGRDGAAKFPGGGNETTFTIKPPNCATGDARTVNVKSSGRPSSSSSLETVSCT